jgi:hypothetical protein
MACSAASVDAFEFSRDALYCSHFCEENVWHLCQKFVVTRDYCNEKGESNADNAEEEGYAVIITSKSRMTPIWRQKLSQSPEKPVLWDYHVVFLVSRMGKSSVIFDHDTTLGFVTEAASYCQLSFKFESQTHIPLANRHIFRVVRAQEYVDYLASDRSHMAESGQKFPPWPAIKGIRAVTPMNLFDDFVNIEKKEGGVGRVVEPDEFQQLFLFS